jgi:hypothetical protein
VVNLQLMLSASLKITVMLPVRLAFVALLLGLREVTLGAVVSAGAAAVVKVQVTGASRLPAASRIAVGPPVNVAVYAVPAVRLAVGFSVATRVVAFPPVDHLCRRSHGAGPR